MQLRDSFVLMILFIIPTRDAVIIIKYHRIQFDFTAKFSQVSSIKDPLNSFTLRSRRLLCHTVIRAKPFAASYNQNEGESLHKFLDAPTTEYLSSRNQFESDNLQSVDESLPYIKRAVQVNNRTRKPVKMLQCVNGWYLSFGLVGQFLYLWQHNKTTKRPSIRTTAIIEPSALISYSRTKEELNKYFLSQILHGKDVMQSVCHFGRSNYIRSCSSAFDALVTKGYLMVENTRVHYIQIYENCAFKRILAQDIMGSFFVLPCSIDGGNLKLPIFYMLADSLQHGSVFIFLPDTEKDIVKLELHVRKIGALLNLSNTHYTFDPLDTFGLYSRKLLCDIVTSARQFIGIYTANYNQEPKNTLESQWLPYFDVINYQQCDLTPWDLNPNFLKYTPMYTQLNGLRTKVKVLQCGNSPVEWHVAYGLVDKFMYLFEAVKKTIIPILHPTAIIEPNALLSWSDHVDSLYYRFSKLINSGRKDEMELICKLRVSDHIRLCGSAFDVLSKNGYLERNIRYINYVRIYKKCVTKRVRRSSLGKTMYLRFRPCLLNEDHQSMQPQFYALIDPQERGALLVFFSNDTGDVLLKARITKVGALLNPSGNYENRVVEPQVLKNKANHVLKE